MEEEERLMHRPNILYKTRPEDTQPLCGSRGVCEEEKEQV